MDLTNTTAPEFTLPNQFGGTTSLSDYKGEWVLVWWIPSTMQEMTPACCDTIAKSFAGPISEEPMTVIGISFDTPAMMKSFSTRASVDFPLLADEDRSVGASYGVLREGDWDCFPRKMAFLLNESHTVVKVYRNIDPDFFVDEVSEDLKSFGVKRKSSLLNRLIGR